MSFVADDSLYRALVEGSLDAIIAKDTNGLIRTWNRSAERLLGWSSSEMIGRPIRALIPDDRQDEEDEILERVRRGEYVSKFETVRLHKDGRRLPLGITISPLRGADGQIVGASKIAHDITDVLAARQERQESEAKFRALADNIPQLAWMANREGWIFWYNQRWFDYTGTDLSSMEGWGWKSVHHPDHVERVEAKIRLNWQSGEPWEDLFPLRGKDGGYRWFLSRALPIRDDDGQILLWFGTNTDVTEQRASEEKIAFLLNELKHRSKNLLAMIQGIVRRTLIPRNEQFLESFDRRLVAVGSNMDMLTKRNWADAPLVEVVRSQISYFKDLIGNRITLSGDAAILLAPQAAEAIGLALHELCTNAGKYGALSNEIGQVEVTWRLDDSAQLFHMSWIERGGPMVTEPSRTGFGSIVIRKNLKAALSGEVKITYDPAGLMWQLVAPSSKVIPNIGG